MIYKIIGWVFDHMVMVCGAAMAILCLSLSMEGML